MIFQQLSLLDLLIPGRTSAKVRPKKRSRHYVDEPFLKDIWLEVRSEFFPSRPDLDRYTVYWSNRNQKRTLASCYTEEQRVIVARELDHLNVHPWLYPLLYHEMCHAYLGENVPRRNGKRAWHGREFRELEMRHPQMGAFNRWVKEGGWASAVRSARTRAYHARKKIAN